MDQTEEYRILQEHLKKALDEAWTRTNNALGQSGGSIKAQEMAVWLAMESVEYTSFLFSLANDLEEVDPPPPPTKGKDISSLIKESFVVLDQMRASRGKEKLADYTHLRNAVHSLRTAFLEFRKKPRKQGRT